MFEATYLNILLNPSYEKPVDTAQDVLERGLTIIVYPGAESIMETLKNSPSAVTRTLAERTIVCEHWFECDNILIPGAVKTGSSVVETGILWPEYLDLGRWHRSKERKAEDNPFGSFMMNKKFTLEEEFNNHILRFQQVTLSSIFLSKEKLHFDIPGWIGEY